MISEWKKTSVADAATVLLKQRWMIKTQAIYFQCGRAIIRSRLWESDAQIDPGTLPTPGDVLSEVSQGRVGGADYDAGWEARANKSLW